MRKIQLEMDALQVESFATDGGERAERGTVLARENTLNCSGYPCGPTDGTQPVDNTATHYVPCICRPADSIDACSNVDC